MAVGSHASFGFQILLLKGSCSAEQDATHEMGGENITMECSNGSGPGSRSGRRLRRSKYRMLFAVINSGSTQGVWLSGTRRAPIAAASGRGDPVLAGKQLPDFRDRPCRAEQIALHFRAAQTEEHFSLLFGLDALCRRRHVPRFGDVDDGLHDRR